MNPHEAAEYELNSDYYEYYDDLYDSESQQEEVYDEVYWSDFYDYYLE